MNIPIPLTRVVVAATVLAVATLPAMPTSAAQAARVLSSTCSTEGYTDAYPAFPRKSHTVGKAYYRVDGGTVHWLVIVKKTRTNDSRYMRAVFVNDRGVLRQSEATRGHIACVRGTAVKGNFVEAGRKVARPGSNLDLYGYAV